MTFFLFCNRINGGHGPPYADYILIPPIGKSLMQAKFRLYIPLR